MGGTWSHDYAVGLYVSVFDAGITFGDGRARAFNNPNPVVVATGSGSAPAETYPLNFWPSLTGQGFLEPLSSSSGTPYTGWRYTNPEDDSVWLFDAAGKVQSQTQRNGWAITYIYNASSQLERVNNHFGRGLVFAYNSMGQLSSVTTPDNSVIVYSYDSQQRLITTTYPDASSKTYLYENSTFVNALTGIVDEVGQRSTYVYDGKGRATSSSLANYLERYVVGYYTGESIVIDPLGTVRSYSYGVKNGKIAVTRSDKPSAPGLSDAASRTQNTQGFVTEETDFLGVKTMYTWDITRRLPLSTIKASGLPESQSTSTQWHPTLRLPTLVTEPGKTTAYSYDSLGNKTAETQTDTATGQARTWSWTYNSQGLVATATDAKGGLWRYTYDAQGNRITTKNPLNHQTLYAHDGAGRVVRETAPNGLVSNYSYDLRGRLLTASTGSETTIYTYHPTGQLASVRLPTGLQASYSYDVAQRLTGASDNRGNTIAYTLDAMGNRLREEVRDTSGALALLTVKTVNNLNRIATLQDASGQATAIAYDANGEAASSTDPLNQTTRQVLDNLRRPIATTFADNAQATQSYNQLDQLTQARDPKGVATSYSRNVWGEVMVETSPDIGTISYQRNAAGEVTSRLDAKGNTTDITRDALGRPLEVRYSATNIARYTWDAGTTGSQVGYLAKLEDASGTTAYQRDAFGRVLVKTQTVNDNPAAPTVLTTAYSYDTTANKGLLASITYPSGFKVIYRRSASGQVLAIDTQKPFANPNRPSAVTNFVTGLTYTALGQPKAWSWASGDAAARSFDMDARMSANEFARYSFDAASRITGITQSLWASKTVTQVIGTGTAIVSQLYQTPLSWTASYDSRNRLTSFNRAGSDASYSYDANSNRLSAIDKTTSDTDLDGSFDADDLSQTNSQALNIESASNKLLGFTQSLSKVRGTKTLATTNSNVSYSLDQNGNLTTDGLRSFEYDPANRLTKVKVSQEGQAAAINYLHNAMGQRVFKSEPKADHYQPNEAELGTDFVTWLKKNFSWLFAQAQADASIGTAYSYADPDAQLPSWALLGEYDNGSAAGKGRTEYIWLPTEDGSAIPLGLIRNGKFFAIHTDHLGTPRLMTNEQNAPVWQWPYSGFGNNKPSGVLKATPNPRAAMTNSPVLLRATGATEMNLRFPGQYADDETGQFYNYFRNYQPSQGRYTQGDPIGLEGGLNRYSYVGGNSLSGTDRFGLATDDEIRRAVATLKCTNSGEFEKLARSISMADMGENGAGMTDWSNNITLNSKLYGDSKTPVMNELRSEFLQTLAHEMLHVNQGVGGKAMSRFKMGNPLGVLHRQLDAKAEGMITRQMLDQFNKAQQNGDTGCSCAR